MCVTINQFIRKFPNIVRYQLLEGLDIFKLQTNLKFSEKINKYLEIIRGCIKDKVKEGLDSILEKIYDYIINEIYDKIYTCELSEEDHKIFQQSLRLSWAEPKHFIKLKREFVFESFLIDALKYFNLINTEKSLRKKLENMGKLFNSIELLLKFNEIGNDDGLDDQLSILKYVFVKAQPLRLWSNCTFMNIYTSEKKNKIVRNQLSQMMSTCSFILDLEPSKLIGVTKEEFIKKCREAIECKISDN